MLRGLGCMLSHLDSNNKHMPVRQDTTGAVQGRGWDQNESMFVVLAYVVTVGVLQCDPIQSASKILKSDWSDFQN